MAFLSLCVVIAIGIGILLGLVLGETENIQRSADFGAYRPALPSLLLDRRGKLITEFFAEERREIVSIYDLPKYLLYSVITKEDRNFLSHPGFSIKGILRAAWNIMAGHYFSGGSTISQQVAGNLYEDRSVTTLGRKFAELWWSFQLEKKKSKTEILEIYLNNSRFGHGNYGVESASQFYFGHSARDLTLAEATLLSVHLSNPETRSMINYPNRAKTLQYKLLNDMAESGYIDADVAETEFNAFWQNFKPVRPGNVSTHTELDDRAVEFSSLIKRRFEELFFASPDLFRDGYIIHTGLDLDYQILADQLLDETVERLGRELEREAAHLNSLTGEVMLPLVELAGTLFGIEGTQVYDSQSSAIDEALETYLEPLLLLDSFLTGGALEARLEYTPESDRVIVAAELVAIDNQTGYILSLSSQQTGGEASPQFITESRRNVGTAVAPFIYAAGIESKSITTATLVYDSPEVVVDSASPILVPRITGAYTGPVPAWKMVSNELVAPLSSLADSIGISRVTELLSSTLSGAFGPDPGIPRSAELAFNGVQATSLQLAQALTVFPRDGSPSLPLAIWYIEDRNGFVFFNNEQATLRDRSRSEAVVSESVAAIVGDAMKRSFTDGTLVRRIAELGGLDRTDFAAVSGSTPAWTDAWVGGFSSHITTVVRVGLVRGEETLGRFQTGASVAGPIWTRFMAEVHGELPPLDHDELTKGVIHRQVCALSGLLPTDACSHGIDTVPFLAGTEPTTLCTWHEMRDLETKLMYSSLLDQFQLHGKPESLTSRDPSVLFDQDFRGEADELGANGENPYLD